jgi:hypothetical protein
VVRRLWERSAHRKQIRVLLNKKLKWRFPDLHYDAVFKVNFFQGMPGARGRNSFAEGASIPAFNEKVIECPGIMRINNGV